ncbi:MAG: TIGR00296 family protein [Nitrososphaerota archaeon]|nr:TIGR00296 family protein [Candidatus Calditenuaceae archaeon]MDW8072872.1 TIGR00296 family protein [Nitrososphaerota archaeon]
MINEDVGAYLVGLARKTIERELGLPAQNLWESRRPEGIENLRRGVFVTLYLRDSRELRGCMGIPIPRSSIVQDTVRAATMAAFHDPRFPPLSRHEVDEVILELTLLTEPELISAEPRSSLPKQIRIGEDGLIIESDERAGLLLPQVAVEYGWGAEEFLIHLCLKAGLRPTDWLRRDVKIYRFGAEIFAEETPRGKIRKVTLPAH